MNIKLIASGSRLWQRWIRHWGLSYLIDDDILFDTFGNPGFLLKNLRRFNVDLGKIKHVVISHDHWDHTGGLLKFLELRPQVTVHIPEQASNDLKKNLHRTGAKIVENAKGHQIKKNVYISSVLTGEYKGIQVAEQAIVLKDGKGVMVLTGCSHPGILKMVEEVRKTFNMPVYGTTGGLHYFRSNDADNIRHEAETLKKYGVEMVAPTHCTGRLGEKIFKEVFGSKYVTMREGQSMTVENRN